jgi:hypothetical protein
MRYFPQLPNYIKPYIHLNFLNCPEQGLTSTERHRQSQEPTVRPQVLCKDVLTGKWHGPSLVLMWGQGHTCVFPEGAEHPVWVLLQFIKPHRPPGPKDEEDETGRLALGQFATKANVSNDQRTAKETATCETDAGRWATHLGSNQETDGHGDDGNQ